MLWFVQLFRALIHSSSALQGYALLLLGTSVTVSGAMYLTADFVLDGVSLNSLRVIPLIADLGALATAPYTQDAQGQRFRGLRADVAEEARRDNTARASAGSSGGFGGGDALAALLDPNRSGAATPVVQNLTSTSTAVAATVTPPPRGPEGSGPVLAPPTMVTTATVVVVAAPPPTPVVVTTAVVPAATGAPTPVGVIPGSPTVVVIAQPTTAPAPPPATATPAATPTPVAPTVAPPPPSSQPTAPPTPTVTAIPAGGSNSPPSAPPPSAPPPSAPTSAPPVTQPTTAPTTAPTQAPTQAPTSTQAPTATQPPATPPPVPSSTPIPIVPTPVLGEPVGEVVLDLRSLLGATDNGSGTGESVFSAIAANLKQPGETFTGPFRVVNLGRRSFRYTLTSMEDNPGGATSGLFTDPNFGLQLKITRRISANQINTVYEGPIKVTNLDMDILVTSGKVDDLGIQIYYPITMIDGLQGQNTSILFKWTATEAVG